MIERCAALDIHKDSLVAAVRVPSLGGGREQLTHTFRTTTAGLLALRDWLEGFAVTVVGMESTGVYWRPVYYLLEERFECWLLNAQHLYHARAPRAGFAPARMRETGLVEVMRFPHPLQFLPYQYEGSEPMERQVLRANDIAIRLIDTGSPGS